RLKCISNHPILKRSKSCSLQNSPQTKQDNKTFVEMALLRMTSTIIKATVDTPTALNALTKALSANLAASIHPHPHRQPKEQLKDRRVSEPVRVKLSVHP
ncbi:hypothetical protein PHMEG_00040796, partial [Phytophthora megakarya]